MPSVLILRGFPFVFVPAYEGVNNNRNLEGLDYRYNVWISAFVVMTKKTEIIIKRKRDFSLKYLTI